MPPRCCGNMHIPPNVRGQPKSLTNFHEKMPTIEIASIESKGLNLNQQDFEVAIIEENILKSHRGLFYDFLINQQGVIIHLGNPDFKTNKECGFFGDQLIIGANQLFKFQFLKDIKTDIDKLIKIAIQQSNISKAYLLTDYQFGPENGTKEIIYTLTDLWTKHDTNGLYFNRLYEIYGA